jgi:hypothetical protein
VDEEEDRARRLAGSQADALAVERERNFALLTV